MSEYKTLSEYFRRMGPAGPLAIIALIAPALGGMVLLWYINPLSEWLKSHHDLGLLIYVSAFIVFAGLALLPTYSQAILGGWAFGFALGFPAALLGFTGAAILGYVVGRRAAGRRVVELINENVKWKAVYDALLGGGFWKTFGLVTLLRLPPNSPFAMTNLVLAATRVPLVVYALATLIGMAPRTGIVVYAAYKVQDLAEARQPWWMYGVSIALVLLVLWIFSNIANQAIARVTATEQVAARET